jgi:hypothetical protein
LSTFRPSKVVSFPNVLLPTWFKWYGSGLDTLYICEKCDCVSVGELAADWGQQLVMLHMLRSAIG